MVRLKMDTKALEAYTKSSQTKQKEAMLQKNLRKEVNVGANGTQKYVLKNGTNAGKIAEKDSFQ